MLCTNTSRIIDWAVATSSTEDTRASWLLTITIVSISCVCGTASLALFLSELILVVTSLANELSTCSRTVVALRAVSLCNAIAVSAFRTVLSLLATHEAACRAASKDPEAWVKIIRVTLRVDWSSIETWIQTLDTSWTSLAVSQRLGADALVEGSLWALCRRRRAKHTVATGWTLVLTWVRRACWAVIASEALAIIIGCGPIRAIEALITLSLIVCARCASHAGAANLTIVSGLIRSLNGSSTIATEPSGCAILDYIWLLARLADLAIGAARGLIRLSRARAVLAWWAVAARVVTAVDARRTSLHDTARTAEAIVASLADTLSRLVLMLLWRAVVGRVGASWASLIVAAWLIGIRCGRARAVVALTALIDGAGQVCDAAGVAVFACWASDALIDILCLDVRHELTG